jgi:ribosomal protein S25
MSKILCITRAVLCEKFKVNGAIARALIKDGAKRGTIKLVGDGSAHFDLFTGVQAKSAIEKAAEDALAAATKKEKKA